MTVGIYRFYNKVTGRSYVGQSKNIEERIKQHFTNIRSKHTYSDTYKKMKEDFEKHGKESFAYEVLEECTVDQLDDREGYYAYLFNVFDSEKGYNTDYWRMKSYESYYRKFNPIPEEEKNRMRFKVYTDNYVRSGNPANPVDLRRFFVEFSNTPISEKFSKEVEFIDQQLKVEGYSSPIRIESLKQIIPMIDECRNLQDQLLHLRREIIKEIEKMVGMDY